MHFFSRIYVNCTPYKWILTIQSATLQILSPGGISRFWKKVTSFHLHWVKPRWKLCIRRQRANIWSERGEDSGQMRLWERGAVLKGVVLKERRGEKTEKRSCRRLSWSEQGRNMERRILTFVYIASMSPQSRPSPTPTFPPLRWQRVWERSIRLSQGFISLLLQLFFSRFLNISNFSLSFSLSLPPPPSPSLPLWLTQGPDDE